MASGDPAHRHEGMGEVGAGKGEAEEDGASERPQNLRRNLQHILNAIHPTCREDGFTCFAANMLYSAFSNKTFQK